MNWPQRNPYETGHPVSTDGSFIDRETELHDLHQAAANLDRRHLIVVGPRRIGKTSLLKRFQAELEGTAMSCSVRVVAATLFHDVRDDRQTSAPNATPDRVAADLLETLTRLIADRIGIAPPDPPEHPHDFSRRVLPRLMEATRGNRLIVLLDELQFLDLPNSDPGAAARLVLDAFATNQPGPSPLLVACWSLSLGEVCDAESLSRYVPSAQPIRIPCFDRNATHSLTELAGAYHWSQEALDWLQTYTGGHPLYLSGINGVLWSRRHLANRTDLVSPSEAADAVTKASDDLEGSLLHAWEQLTTVQSRLGRALAALTVEPHGISQSIAPNSVALDEIQSQLCRDGYRFETGALMEALPGLIQNGVVIRDSEGYRLVAPFLARWLATKDYRELTRGCLRRHLLAASRHIQSGNRSLAREELLKAEQCDEQNDQLPLTDLVFLAELEDEAKQHAEALEHYRKLWKRNPAMGRAPLCDALVRQTLRIVDAGDDPARAWDELCAVDRDRERIEQQDIAGAVAEASLKRWRQCLARGDEVGAAAAFANLADMHPRGWRDRAARRYTEFLEQVTPDKSRLLAGLAAIRDGFLILTEGEIAPDGERRLGALEERFSDRPEILKEIRDTLACELGQPWWSETLRVLRLAWQRLPLAEGPMLSALVLEKLIVRAPDAHRTELTDLLACNLPSRFGPVLASDLVEATRLIKLLGDWLESPPLSKVCDCLEDHVVSLDGSGISADPAEDDRRVRRFLSQGARVYRVLLESQHREQPTNLPQRILEQITVLVDRALRPRAGGGKWALLREESEAIAEWLGLLNLPVMAASSVAGDLASAIVLPPEERPHRPVHSALPDAIDADFEELLRTYEMYTPRELVVEIPGVPKENLRFFRATRRLHDSPPEEVNVKVYKLPRPGEYPAIRELLLTMWEKERRLLEDLSSRSHGRGLTAFRASYIDPHRGYLLVVTEPVSGRTLRDLLTQGDFGAGAIADRGKLWRKLFWVIEAVHTMHQAGYLHRAIRPENVLESKNDDVSPLKLANFEWSVYLQALAERQTVAWRPHDYYFPPEILTRRHSRDRSHAAAGETFASDIYALGLLLFEVLVRRLDTELDLYSHGGTYSYDAHCRWIAQLGKEAATRLDSIEERYLIERMLAAEPADRETDLTRAVESAWRLVCGTSDLSRLLNDERQRPLLVSLFWRNTPDSLDRYLSTEVDLSGVGPTQEDLGQFAAAELAGARVFRNGGDVNWPLLLQGRRVTFVAQPFQHEGHVFRQIPFFIVARFRDWKSGPALARLPTKIDMLDLAQARQQVSHGEMGNMIRRGLVWERLFLQAARPEDDILPPQRELHSLLTVTAEIERAIWDEHVIPYRLIENGQSDDLHDLVWIEARDTDGRESLVRFVSQQVARELVEFELSTRSYATAPFAEGPLWAVKQVDRQNLRIQMIRKREQTAEKPPVEGFLRPLSLRGNQSIYLRRRNLLNRLEDDPFLLKSVSEENRSIPYQAEIDSFFNPELDEGKRTLVRQIMKTGPLFVVQGPPGTGKTTLATEVIRQTLHRHRAAGTGGRILITSQAHAPLNHLLQEVRKAVAEPAQKRRRRASTDVVDDSSRPAIPPPVIIRLVTEGRLGTSELAARDDVSHVPSGRESDDDECARRFHPSAVAADIAAHALAWEPGSNSLFPRALVGTWRNFIAERKSEVLTDLEGRLRRTANLVFVTANDREVYGLGEDSVFDLLIYEEAAKAYPLEVLAPMLHARRWLLIGDQDQLPPFAIESFAERLEATFKEFKDLAGGGSLRRSTKGASPDRLQLNQDSLARAHKLIHFFEYLFDLGEQRGFSNRLQTQWRMHPEIGILLRDVYYDFLKNGDESQLRQSRVHRVVRHPCLDPPGRIARTSLIWIDTPLALSNRELWAERASEGGGYRNYYEGHAVFQFLRQVETRGRAGFDGDILLLSPYHAQVKLLRQFTRSWTRDKNRQTGDLRDRAETVDSAQGRQAGVVIVSLVRNNPEAGGVPAFGFLTSAQRSGVMFSRAESLLVIVGCSAHFAKEPALHINRVFRHIEETGIVIDARHLIDSHSLKLLREHEARRRRDDDLFR